MKRILLSLAAVAALLLGLSATTVSAQAAAPGDVEITRVWMDAVGADDANDTWREVIVIKNTGTGEVNVKGWKTQDKWAHTTENNPKGCNTITFRKATSVTDAGGFQHLSTHNDGLWLPAGEEIWVYTGGDEDETDNARHTVALNKPNCGYKGHYLNNNDDHVWLLDENGDTVDHVWYNWAGANYKTFS